MLFLIILLSALNLVIATPPACFIRCINGISNICEKNQADIKCLCKIHEAVNQCIALHCPADHFYSARDHFGGTCAEHGFSFATYQADVPYNEITVAGFQSEDEDGFDSDGSDCDSEEVYATESYEDSSSDSGGSAYSGDSGGSGDSGDSGDWSEGSEWLEGSDWPDDSDLDLSELNKDVIKNYMGYFLKQKPSSQPISTSPREILNPDSKPDGPNKATQRPFIVHGPSNYVPTIRNAAKNKEVVHKSRYHKYDGGFDRDKQDQILRRRF